MPLKFTSRSCRTVLIVFLLCNIQSALAFADSMGDSEILPPSFTAKDALDKVYTYANTPESRIILSRYFQSAAVFYPEPDKDHGRYWTVTWTNMILPDNKKS